MGKRRPNEEVVLDGDKELKFSSDFGFLQALNTLGRDVAQVFADLAGGLMPPADVRNVLQSSIQGHDGEEEAAAVDLINRFGLQECAILARLLLSHALIGDKKKSQMLGMEKTRALLDSLLPSRLENLKRLGWLWAAISLTSAGLVCLIFKYSGLLSW